MIDIRIGDARKLIHDLNDESIDCVVTSPPYYGLRDYKTEPIIFDGQPDCEHEWINHRSGLIHENRNNCKGSQEDVLTKTKTVYIKKYDDKISAFCSKCGAWRGQLGLEPTPELFIKHLLDFFDDVKMKLKDNGNCFINLADTYWGGGNASGHTDKTAQFGTVTTLDHGFVSNPVAKGNHLCLRSKSLCMVPQRFAWGMIERGWILRNEIIWWKKNHMPESVRDRWTKSHEVIYFFTKDKQNYFNLNLIKEPLSEGSLKRISQKNIMNQNGGDKQLDLRGIPESGNASRCNKMMQNVAKKYFNGNGKKNPGDVWLITLKPYRKAHFATFPLELVRQPILSGCPENGTVLDPFAGSGTVGEFCKKNNRNAILFDLNPSYRTLMEERVACCEGD